jgi:hypothetical protein
VISTSAPGAPIAAENASGLAVQRAPSPLHISTSMLARTLAAGAAAPAAASMPRGAPPRARSRAPQPRGRRAPPPPRAAAGADGEDLDAELEAFMRRQAEIESGAAAAARRAEVAGKVVGAAEVDDDAAKAFCRDIVGVLKTLQETRDMSVNEIRLTVAIEDPRARERRGMVVEGRVPGDRIALRELAREMTAWPMLDEPAPATAAGAVPGGDGARPAVGRDPNEAPQSVLDMLPDWVGYGGLYLVSGLPVVIVAAVVAILWSNSLH